MLSIPPSLDDEAWGFADRPLEFAAFSHTFAARRTGVAMLRGHPRSQKRGL
jgi:hypothetical protein